MLQLQLCAQVYLSLPLLLVNTCSNPLTHNYAPNNCFKNHTSNNHNHQKTGFIRMSLWELLQYKTNGPTEKL